MNNMVTRNDQDILTKIRIRLLPQLFGGSGSAQLKNIHMQILNIQKVYFEIYAAIREFAHVCKKDSSFCISAVSYSFILAIVSEY